MVKNKESYFLNANRSYNHLADFTFKPGLEKRGRNASEWINIKEES